MNSLRAWIIALLVTAAAVTSCYLWVDRPVALFVHDHFHGTELFPRLTHIAESFIPVAALALVVLGIRALTRRSLTTWQAVILLCSISLVAAEAVKNQLKFVFGRTWPETWVHNNPSFIHDGAYGFNLFHAGSAFESFPSGHATVICAFMSVLWICYPKFRALYLIVVAAVAVGLVGADFHFVSDIIAGGFLGISSGWFAVRLWEGGGPHKLASIAQGELVWRSPKIKTSSTLISK
jgi:membrane-associated phospholipid phosphatase